jgi:hypothetical protein
MNRGKAAMALSATLHGGPLMYYYGQEVGVNPTKSEGFQGEDGRTTIFDYWGVPEFQAWVNGGKFDGGKLSPEQKKLRKFYAKLNEFVSSSDVVKNGKFWDLQYANVEGQSSSYDKHKIYSYVRYLDKERLLFVYNFDYEDKQNVDLRLPEDLFNQLNIEGQQLTFTEVFTGELKINMQSKALTSTRPDVLGMSLTIDPGSFKVFKF